jgi:hypothetical protein
MNKNIMASLYSLLCLSAGAAYGQIQNPPASNVLGTEDIWENPTFVGGITNGGTTAFSEW